MKLLGLEQSKIEAAKLIDEAKALLAPYGGMCTYDIRNLLMDPVGGCIGLYRGYPISVPLK